MKMFFTPYVRIVFYFCALIFIVYSFSDFFQGVPDSTFFSAVIMLLVTHIMRLLISLWDVGTVFFTIYPQVFRHEKSSIYYKYIEPLSYCFSISFKILIITVYGFMKWYICKCLFCKVYLLDLSYNRNAKPMTGSNELRFNLTQIRG
ncbi:hypothetical protein DS369_20095 [Salmonella enterica subsp. enterica serovar Typhimurium]|nr:hypothetical protein [Salmonella enterica subsp. enterica serovar Typhimurium]